MTHIFMRDKISYKKLEMIVRMAMIEDNEFWEDIDAYIDTLQK